MTVLCTVLCTDRAVHRAVTPRWLTSQGRDKEALHILNTVTCCDDDDDPDAVLAELKAAVRQLRHHCCSSLTRP